MNKLKAIICSLVIAVSVNAQEFMATVTVDYSQVQGSNTQAFRHFYRRSILIRERKVILSIPPDGPTTKLKSMKK